MIPEEKHERFMRIALSEARKSLGQTSPNPAVGAILVRRKQIVARGHHRHDVVVELQVGDCEPGEADRLAPRRHRDDVAQRQLPADRGQVAEGEPHVAGAHAVIMRHPL